MKPLSDKHKWFLDYEDKRGIKRAVDETDNISTRKFNLNELKELDESFEKEKDDYKRNIEHMNAREEYRDVFKEYLDKPYEGDLSLEERRKNFWEHQFDPKGVGLRPHLWEHPVDEEKKERKRIEKELLENTKEPKLTGDELHDEYMKVRKKYKFLFDYYKKSTLISKASKDKPTAGIFITLPDHLSKQFPLLGQHDDSDPHATVLFIGCVAKKQERLLLDTVKNISKGFSPFEVKLDEKITYFPATKSSDGCKVAKIEIISTELHKLNGILKKALTDAEIDIDDHFPKYKPHITLSYMSPGRKTYGRDFPQGSWVVSEIHIWNGDKRNTIQLGSTKEAFLSIRAALEDELSTKYPNISESIHNAAYRMDKKYLRWFARELSNNKVEAITVSDYIQEFINYQQLLPSKDIYTYSLEKLVSKISEIKGLKNKAIGIADQYRDLLQTSRQNMPREKAHNYAREFLNRIGPPILQSLVRKNIRQSIQKREQLRGDEKSARADSDVIYEDDNFLVVLPGSTQASNYFGAGTQWCTATTDSQNYFEEYALDGMYLYYIINKNAEQNDAMGKIAVIYMSFGKPQPNEVYDKTDKIVDMPDVYTYLSENQGQGVFVAINNDLGNRKSNKYLDIMANMSPNDLKLRINSYNGSKLISLLYLMYSVDFVNKETKKMFGKEVIRLHPYLFFHKYMYLRYPELEKEAAESLSQKNSKTFFSMGLHNKYPELSMVPAKKLLDNHDYVNFMGNGMHKRYPNMFRDAAEHLADKSPGTFRYYDLGEIYPDLEKIISHNITANTNRNISKRATGVSGWISRKGEKSFDIGMYEHYPFVERHKELFGFDATDEINNIYNPGSQENKKLLDRWIRIIGFGNNISLDIVNMTNNDVFIIQEFIGNKYAPMSTEYRPSYIYVNNCAAYGSDCNFIETSFDEFMMAEGVGDLDRSLRFKKSKMSELSKRAEPEDKGIELEKFPKKCSCGLEYSEEEFYALPLRGNVYDGPPDKDPGRQCFSDKGWPIEFYGKDALYRDCVCKSTMTAIVPCVHIDDELSKRSGRDIGNWKGQINRTSSKVYSLHGLSEDLEEQLLGLPGAHDGSGGNNFSGSFKYSDEIVIYWRITKYSPDHYSVMSRNYSPYYEAIVAFRDRAAKKEIDLLHVKEDSFERAVEQLIKILRDIDNNKELVDYINNKNIGLHNVIQFPKISKRAPESLYSLGGRLNLHKIPELSGLVEKYNITAKNNILISKRAEVSTLYGVGEDIDKQLKELPGFGVDDSLGGVRDFLDSVGQIQYSGSIFLDTSRDIKAWWFFTYNKKANIYDVLVKLYKKDSEPFKLLSGYTDDVNVAINKLKEYLESDRLVEDANRVSIPVGANEDIEAYGNVSLSKRADSLSEYNKKRDFSNTSEPKGETESDKNQYRFVIQKHDADKAELHFDLRLEIDSGVMESFVIPKAHLPKEDERLLVIKTEDHPLSYRFFEGKIKKGYGKGDVKIHDSGTYKEIDRKSDTIKFKLCGKKEKGSYTLHRADGEKWLIMVAKDENSN